MGRSTATSPLGAPYGPRGDCTCPSTHAHHPAAWDRLGRVRGLGVGGAGWGANMMYNRGVAAAAFVLSPTALAAANPPGSRTLHSTVEDWEGTPVSGH